MESLKATIKPLMIISRPEFIPANSASLVIGVSWGLTLPVDVFLGLVLPLVLTYATLFLVASFAAQINTIGDYDSDVNDPTKKSLVQALSHLKRGTVKTVMLAELAVSLAIIGFLVLFLGKPFLLLFWVAGVFFAYCYSSPPLRLKSRGLLAVVSLIVVLSVLPVTFVTYVFTTSFAPAFFVFLLGQALTVYAVIVPAEIRDYFADKTMGVQTMTVQLGLPRASELGIGLLSVGAVLCGVGFALGVLESSLLWLSVFVVIIPVAYGSILRQYLRLYGLSKKHAATMGDQADLEEEITRLAAKNPKWITLVTQTIVVVCLVLLVSKLV